MYLPLPSSFYSVLSNTTLKNSGEESRLAQDVTFALAMAVRTGIVATFPEVQFSFPVFFVTSMCFTCITIFSSQPALDLFSREELRAALSGGQGYGPPSALLLHLHATYESPLCAEDAHIMVSLRMICWASIVLLPCAVLISFLLHHFCSLS